MPPNQSLLHGSMLPYVERAQALGWAVVVANPNVNTADDGWMPRVGG